MGGGRGSGGCYNPASFFPGFARATASMTSTAELSSPASANTSLTNASVDADYTLDHKYTRESGRIYLSGVGGGGRR